MSFSPGQFITAQRLNRLQPSKYWVAASGTFAASLTAQDVAGTSIPLTIETDGAEVTFWWTAAVYAGASAPTTLASCRPFLGADGATVFAVGDWRIANAKGTVGNTWSTTVPTAGSYTAKLNATTPANTTLSVYTTMLVEVTEVA